MFNANSGLVQVWVRLVKDGIYTADQIPAIENLKAVVNSVLEGGATV